MARDEDESMLELGPNGGLDASVYDDGELVAMVTVSVMSDGGGAVSRAVRDALEDYKTEYPHK